MPFLAAQIEITGKVCDCERKPLVGVSVELKSGKKTESYSLTDINGLYKIIVPDTNSVINYSYIGYTTQKIRVGNRDTINVFLKENVNSLDNDIILVKRPVIYLYPTAETEISVKIDYKGKLFFTYPEYENGWNVTAMPNGLLRNKKDGREYSYLFWEGEKKQTNAQTIYEDGFIVHKDKVVEFLQKILPEFGLTPYEYNEFIVFWTPYLMQNEWNFIYFRFGENYDEISKNIVHPKPQTIIRVFMEFKGINEPIEIEPQKIKTILRKGFTLVEWGGAELQQTIRVKQLNEKYIEK